MHVLQTWQLMCRHLLAAQVFPKFRVPREFKDVPLCVQPLPLSLVAHGSIYWL